MGNSRRGPKNVDSGKEGKHRECSIPQADSSFSES